MTASYLFESNIIGGGMWCFTLGQNDRIDRTELVGSKGKISFSFFEPKPIEIITSEKTLTVSIDYPQHVQQSLINSVVEDILGSGNCVSTGNSAARTNWILEQILG